MSSPGWMPDKETTQRVVTVLGLTAAGHVFITPAVLPVFGGVTPATISPRVMEGIFAGLYACGAKRFYTSMGW